MTIIHLNSHIRLSAHLQQVPHQPGIKRITTRLLTTSPLRQLQDIHPAKITIRQIIQLSLVSKLVVRFTPTMAISQM